MKKETKNNEEILKKQLEEQTKLKEEYLNDLKRITAEFQNYQKRIEQEKIEFIKYSKEDLILKLLELKDNFERALKNNDDREGIELIHKQLKDILEKENVKEINEDVFNPEKHEIISVEKGEENKILEEYQKGYTLHKKTIRTAKVKVGKGENKDEGKSDTGKE
jgi:molecular chaperone GrpE